MWILDWLFGDPVTPEWLTVTLPITLTGAKVLLAMLGLMLSSGLVWLMLNAPDRAERRRDLLTDWLTALGWVLLPFWFLLLAGTLWHLWLLFSGLDSFLDNVGFGMGAVVAAFLGGPFVIWGAVLKHRTVEFQKEGHITERISKAVEQLGAEKEVSRPMRNVTYEIDKEVFTELEGRDEPSKAPPNTTNIKRGDWQITARTMPNIEVRIGGLLSLERIAQDSTRYDRGRDHVRVMEILCAYVRENAPASQAKKRTIAGQPIRDWVKTLRPPREDIALALRIIGRRSADQRRIEAGWGPEASDKANWIFDESCPDLPDPPGDQRHPEGAVEAFKTRLSKWQETIHGYKGYCPDLRNTNLQRADLSQMELSGTLFDGAQMSGADFRSTRMVGANLTGARLESAIVHLAQLQGVYFVGASLEGADLSRARMEGANLGAVRMSGATLSEARMTGTVLWEARMEGTFFWKARMDGATLTETQLQGASLRKASLQYASLSRAHLEDADLSEARLERANLSWALMNGANLAEASLEGTSLWNAQMERADLREARMDATTDPKGADFSSASLRGVNCVEVGLSQKQINGLFADSSMTLPVDREKPAHWPMWHLPVNDFYDEWRKWQADPEGYEPPQPPDDAAEKPAE